MISAQNNCCYELNNIEGLSGALCIIHINCLFVYLFMMSDKYLAGNYYCLIILATLIHGAVAIRLGLLVIDIRPIHC